MNEHNVYPYHVFKAAIQKFGRKPADLTPEERAEIGKIADKTVFVESRILNSREAKSVRVPHTAVAKARGSMIDQYGSFCAFLSDLTANGLDDAILYLSIERQLSVDEVFAAVAEKDFPITEEEIVSFYNRRKEAFSHPERRAISHILITINPDYPENTRTQARKRIVQLKSRLDSGADSFGLLAQLHSECPTALRGGDLGMVTRDQLMKPLADVAFSLAHGEVSDPVETEAGFHVAKCNQIVEPRLVTLQEVRPAIIRALDEAKRAQAKRQWIKRQCAAEPDAPAVKPNPERGGYPLVESKDAQSCSV
jgi:peptidyl-prolyl cis-trans isomerase C